VDGSESHQIFQKFFKKYQSRPELVREWSNHTPSREFRNAATHKWCDVTGLSLGARYDGTPEMDQELSTFDLRNDSPAALYLPTRRGFPLGVKEEFCRPIFQQKSPLGVRTKVG